MRIHFVGIKGVGMAPLAIIAKEAGFSVSGCDVAESFITDQSLKSVDIIPSLGFSSDHINNIDLIITTGAHGGLQNPEVNEARKRKIKILTQGEAVGYFMSGKLFNRTDIKGISVAGCHGKTTTAAFISTILVEAGADPTYIIGSTDLKPLGLPGHYGKGEYFVAEADEYITDPQTDNTPKFLWQKPAIAIINNIEWDHPDVYKSIDEVREVYREFVKKIKHGGTLIANGDDPEIKKILEDYEGKIITFGSNSKNDYQLQNIIVKDGKTSFSLKISHELETFSLSLLGEHNALNATAAIIASLQIGIPINIGKNSLLLFKGTKRRLEFLGETKYKALVYDDYAHHPTAIRKTLHALKEIYPHKKVVCVFQPHTFSRTKMLFDQFVSSFKDADSLVIVDIYPSGREKFDASINSKDLVNAISLTHKDAIFLPGLKDVVKYMDEKKYSDSSVIVLMGAGDIYKAAEEIVES